MKKYTEEQWAQKTQEAYSLWKQGLSNKQIAKQMGITSTTVGKYLLEFPEYKSRDKEITSRKCRMKEYFEQGKTDLEISQLEHCSIATVSRHRSETDYVLKPKRQNQLGNLPIGFSWKWPVTVNRLLKAAGKKTQPVPEHSREAERQWFTA